MALSICFPVEACPPVIGKIRPILNVSSARAGASANAPMATAARADHAIFLLATSIYPSSLKRLWYYSTLSRFAEPRLRVHPILRAIPLYICTRNARALIQTSHPLGYCLSRGAPGPPGMDNPALLLHDSK